MWHKRYRITWHVSPLEENPETVDFDFWDELQEWTEWHESNIECFDLDLCHIQELDTQ